MELTPKRAAIGLAVIVLILSGYLLDWLIVTDTERIERAVKEMSRCVEERDVDGLFAHVSPYYHDGKRDAVGLRALAMAFFSRYSGLSLWQRGLVVNVSGRRAVATVRVFVDAGRDGLSGQSEWELDFEQSAGGRWQVTRLAPVRFGTREVDGWDGTDAERLR